MGFYYKPLGKSGIAMAYCVTGFVMATDSVTITGRQFFFFNWSPIS